jgi:hypothetical protein
VPPRRIADLTVGPKIQASTTLKHRAGENLPGPIFISLVASAFYFASVLMIWLIAGPTITINIDGRIYWLFWLFWLSWLFLD